MEETGESETPATKFQLAIQRSRASLFLSELRSSLDRRTSDEDINFADEERLRNQVVDLSREIYMEPKQRRFMWCFENVQLNLTFVVLSLFFLFSALELTSI